MQRAVVLMSIFIKAIGCSLVYPICNTIDVTLTHELQYSFCLFIIEFYGWNGKMPMWMTENLVLPKSTKQTFFSPFEIMVKHNI